MRFSFALAAALAFAAPAAVVAQAADPAVRIGAYNDGIVAIMKAKLPAPERVRRFDALVRAHYDMPAIAALVVGPKWAALPPADKTAAIAALTTHSAVSLAANFVRDGGEKFAVDPKVAARDTSRVVRTTIAYPGGSSMLVYRLRERGGEWRIVDVVAEGVSQLAVQRAEFASTVARGGIPALASQLAKADAVLLR